jgi:hypothetical protein
MSGGPSVWTSPTARGTFFSNGVGKALPFSAERNAQQAIQEALLPTPEVTTTALNATKTLTASNRLVHLFLGTATGQSLVFPAATTLAQGWFFDVWNLSSAAIAIKDAGGNVLVNLRANGRTIAYLRDATTSNGIWALTYTLDNGNAFGTELLIATADAETSNNSQTTWANKITLTTPASLALGDYLINFQFQWRAANANRNADVRVQYDAADLENWQPFMNNVSERQLLSGFTRVQNISGAHTFTLDFRVGPASGTTVYMSRARMFAWRIL